MSKLSNILIMLNLLLSNQKIKISELAEIIGVKERMIRKYKEDLIEAGFNIVSQPGKDGGYILENDEKNEFQRFSNNELDAIMKMIEHHQHISSYYENEYELESILTKIKGYSHYLNSGEVKTTSYFDYPLPNVDFEDEKKKLTDIKEAIRDSGKLKIKYFSVSSGLTTRIIYPSSLVYRKGFWYTIAFCENRTKTLTFKNCRISAYEKLGEKFEKEIVKANLTRAGKHFGISGDDEFEVVLKIEFPMSLYIKERVWAFDQYIKIDKEDYSIIFKGTMSGFSEIKRWVLGMGRKVTVLKPEKLLSEIEKEILEMATKFDRN